MLYSVQPCVHLSEPSQLIPNITVRISGRLVGSRSVVGGQLSEVSCRGFHLTTTIAHTGKNFHKVRMNIV